MRLGTLAATLLLSCGLAHAQTETTPTRELVLYYYMAYDNNLERCGPPILDMLQKGVTTDDLAVVVSADFSDKGMHRYELTHGAERKETHLEEEGSAEEETLAAELAWLEQHYPAKKYGIVFLNHGGGLGQMSVDDAPREGGQRWLYPPEVSKVITAWRAQVQAAQGEVELVFYQQCGKGSIENYHCMRTAARYVMGSQTVVGAPNYYYPKALAHVAEHPEVDGKELAKQITERETPNMFTTYSTFDSAQLDRLPEVLDRVLEPLLALETIVLPGLGRELPTCFDFGRQELFFDGLALFKALYEKNALDPAPIAELEAYHAALITSHRVSPQQVSRAGTWCGYSLFFPVHPKLLERYADYPIYADTKLDEFFSEVFRQALARRAEQGRRPEGGEQK
ncbi:MAG: clostripain-related cysteine peptidase [Planctomycetota bacterium]